MGKQWIVFLTGARPRAEKDEVVSVDLGQFLAQVRGLVEARKPWWPMPFLQGPSDPRAQRKPKKSDLASGL